MRARVCRPVAGDHVAVVGDNRKLLVFPTAELPEMGRGKGVRLQRYKDGGLADAIAFDLADGLALEGPGRPHPHRRRQPSSPNGSAPGPAPAGWRRAAFRARTGSTDRRRPGRQPAGNCQAFDSNGFISADLPFRKDCPGSNNDPGGDENPDGSGGRLRRTCGS